jgi:RHS repeat-associated protein
MMKARGFVTAFRYDDANRVRQILDARNGQTQFSYDLNGNLLTVTDAKNQTTTYTYDPMDRLATRKDALNRTETYQYDLAGNLTQFTDRKNQTTTFAYDALNRRTGATYPDATVTFGYDAINRLTSVNDSVGGTITWTYDTVSGGHHPRVLETTTPGTVTVEYDEIGRRLKLSATSLTDVTYAYDNNSRLTGVTQGSQTITLAYDDAGRRTSLTYPNAVVTSYGYDNANRLLTINHVKTPTTIEALTYQYDPASNRISLNRANAAASLIPSAVSSNSYDATNEQTQFNGVTQTFDANGNLTNDGTNTYTWDARNRLTAISGGVTASFGYDGLGRRKSKTIGGTTTGFWHDGADMLAELSGTTPTAIYIRSLGIDETFIRKLTGGDEFFQADALENSVTLTNAAGTAQTTYTYEPFGATTQSGTSSSNTVQYTGREHDLINLYYYRARYYSEISGRFIGEDPIGLSGGINRYAYAVLSPINFSDPFGLYTLEELAAIVYNESASLNGSGIYDVRDAIAFIAVNREVPGRLDVGIAPPKLTANEITALRRGIPSVQIAYGQALVAAARALAKCSPDPTDGAREFNFRGSESLVPRRGTPVFLNIGPLTNSNPTIGNPRVPLAEQLPANGVYFNVFLRPRP